MQKKYVRFVVGGSQKKAESQHGILAELSYLQDSDKLTESERIFCQNFFDWLNELMPEPPFERKKWSTEAVSWLKNHQTDLIARFREICFFLEEKDIMTSIVYSSNPGMILYEDDFQIVSIPNRT